MIRENLIRIATFFSLKIVLGININIYRFRFQFTYTNNSEISKHKIAFNFRAIVKKKRLLLSFFNQII